MEDSGYCTRGSPHFDQSGSGSIHHILNLQFSELANSKYSYFLHGFKDEQDFEDFKQDLRDFQKLKQDCCGQFKSGSGASDREDRDSWQDLTEEIQFIRRPNNICKNRRKCSGNRASNRHGHKGASRAASQHQLPLEGDLPAASTGCCGPSYSMVGGRVADPLRPLSRSDSRNSPVGSDQKSDILDKLNELRASIASFLMEFMNKDENFREFERVFDTVNNKDRDDDCYQCNRSAKANEKGQSIPAGPSHLSEDAKLSSLPFVNDLFSDFFDHDETFMEFEKEFQKFRARRRSTMTGSLKSMGSSRDIFQDVAAFCERDLRGRRGSQVSEQDSGADAGSHPAEKPGLVWRSVEDWARILLKMRRNSRLLLLDMPEHACRHRHRHSIGDGSSFQQQLEPYEKSQSLADLRQSGGSMIGSSPCPGCGGQRARMSVSSTDLRPSSSASSSGIGVENLALSSQTLSPALSTTLSNAGDDSWTSDERWSLSFDGDHRYSSTSTLCSDGEDFSCPLSCSGCSDLEVDSDEEDESLADEGELHLRERSQSLIESSSQPPHPCLSAGHLFSHAAPYSSFGVSTNLPTPGTSTGAGRPPDCHLPLLFDHDWSTVDHAGQTVNHDGQTVNHDGQTVNQFSSLYDSDDSYLIARPVSSLSLTLSEAESESYLTATSDLSDHYSTAKSDLSNVLAYLPSGCPSRSSSFDLTDHVSPFNTSSRRDPRPLIGQYHSYHGREYPFRHRRQLSGPACQYTCHQSCVPAVTLNCQSVSDDGQEVPVPRLPSPSDFRSQLETSLSVGSISVRPGCARSVNPETPKASESVPNLQRFAQDNNRVSRHLLRSSSEGIFQSHIPGPESVLYTPPLHLVEDHNTSSAPSCPSSQPPPHQQTCYHTLTASPTISSNRKLLAQNLPESPTLSSLTTSFNHGVSIGAVALPEIQSNREGNEPHHTTEKSDGGLLHDFLVPEGTTSLFSETDIETNQETATENDETDSGYRSGTIPDDQLPRVPSQGTLDRQDLCRKIAKFNHFVPAANLLVNGKESFQGFLKVTMNLIRPITMELGARPPSIYELLTREHIIEENTQQVAFYMPRDTHKSLHINSDTTTKEVVTSLLKKFHILDHPRKFAMYEQEFNDRNKLVRLRRLTDKDCPLRALLGWDPERIRNYRLVLQENETGEIQWDVFSLPELGNFLKVLDREEKETILELKHKYAFLKQYMERRLAELRTERQKPFNC